MVFRPPKKQPQFADLNGILAQSKETESSLYQVVQILLERLTQFQMIVNEVAKGKLSNSDAVKKFATRFATFHTKEDDSSVLPNSVQLLQGFGITFDDSVPNKRTIHAALPAVREIPVGVLDGINVTFTLANTPVPDTEQVYLNGLLQDTRGIDYSITGAVITFLLPPLASDRILVTYWKV